MRLFVSTLALFAISAPALAGCMASSDEDTMEAVQAQQQAGSQGPQLSPTPQGAQVPAQPAECAPAQGIACPEYSTPVSVPGPTYQAPTYPGATYGGPTVTGPTFGKPTYQQGGTVPSIGAPQYPAPTYAAPTFQGPTYQAPTYLGPTYLAPTYQAPIYEAPMSPAQWLPAPISPCVQPLPSQAIPVPQPGLGISQSHL